MRITCVTIDCADPGAVAHFWSEALRWSDCVVSENGVGAICRPPSGGTYLEFIRVPEGKTVKNRVHLGCNAGTLHELEADIARLRLLGATLAWEEEFPSEIAVRYRNVIMRYIEGNEFCIGAGDPT